MCDNIFGGQRGEENELGRDGKGEFKEKFEGVANFTFLGGSWGSGVT